jgi:hypothetical protein
MSEVLVSTADAARLFRKLQIQSKSTRHQTAGFLVVDGKKVLNLQYGHGRASMPAFEFERFRRLLHVSADEAARLLECSMSRSSYIALLRANGVISSLPPPAERFARVVAPRAH